MNHHTPLRCNLANLANLAILALGLLAACGAGTEPAPVEVDPDAEAIIPAPEGMEGWEHLMGHNNTDKSTTSGMNKRREGLATLYHKNGVKSGEGAFDALGDGPTGSTTGSSAGRAASPMARSSGSSASGTTTAPPTTRAPPGRASARAPGSSGTGTGA